MEKVGFVLYVEHHNQLKSMPRYSNRGKSIVLNGGVKIPANSEYESLVWLDEDKYPGLCRVSDFPCFNPVVMSEFFDAPKAVIKIPKGLDRFALHLYVESGSPVIYFNTVENRPPLRLYAGAKWNIRVYERVIDVLFVDFESHIGRLWVILERV